MTRLTCSFALAGAIALIGISDANRSLEARVDEHAYFNNLVSRIDHWKSYSLRNSAQLQRRRDGGYSQCDSCPLYVTYSYPNDPDERRQDAAKVLIPDFVDRRSLVAPISAGDTTIQLSGSTSVNPRYSLKIDDEIMTVTAKDQTTLGADRPILSVLRAQAGTVAAPHAAGALVGEAVNSLPNQVWLPMRTTDGHSYLTTWDAWYGHELRPQNTGLTNWKTYQFRAKDTPTSTPGIWFEVRTRFDGGTAPFNLPLNPASDIGVVDARHYSVTIGPNVVRNGGVPARPQVGTMMVKAQTWTRYWVLIEQYADSFDLVTMWVADAVTDPIKVVDRLQLENFGLVDHFDLEFNTSEYVWRPGRGPLTTYVRNVVMLRDVADVASLLQRPAPGAPLPPFPRTIGTLPPPPTGTRPPSPTPPAGAPSAPRGVRIVPPTH